MESLSRVSLLKTPKDYALFAFFISILALFSILYNYENYLNLKRFNWHTMSATVISEKRVFKNSKSFTYYKLKTNHFTFYTSSFENLRSLEGLTVKIAINTSKIRFLDYLRGFYASSKFIGLFFVHSLRFNLFKKIKDQHKDSKVSNLYAALYLAWPISSSLRQRLTNLGINHLAAISGFHLGFLSFFIFFISSFFYKYLHQYFFPFRNKIKDITLFSLVILSFYIAFLDFTPSLIRSFGMMLVGFTLFIRGIKIISFNTLAITTTILLALFPSLLFSIGFRLSVFGVFILFLIIKHSNSFNKYILFVFLHIAIFILIMPYTTYLFGQITLGQLLSPLLSMLFIIFYPLSIFATLAGYANIFDSMIMTMLSWKFQPFYVNIPWQLMIGFVGLLFVSIKSKYIFFITLTITPLMLLLLTIFTNI